MRIEEFTITTYRRRARIAGYSRVVIEASDNPTQIVVKFECEHSKYIFVHEWTE